MALCSSDFSFSALWNLGTIPVLFLGICESLIIFLMSQLWSCQKQLNKMKPGKSCQRLQRMSEMAHMMGP